MLRSKPTRFKGPTPPPPFGRCVNGEGGLLRPELASHPALRYDLDPLAALTSTSSLLALRPTRVLQTVQYCGLFRAPPSVSRRTCRQSISQHLLGSHRIAVYLPPHLAV